MKFKKEHFNETHIKINENNNLIEKSKSLTIKKYIENLLIKISEKTNLNLGELDLYLWYEKTGNALK